MSRLSIFSSDTLNFRCLLPGVATLAICAGFYMMIDLALRAWDPVLFGGWENPGLQNKVETAHKVAEEHGSIDVLLMSVSIGLQIDVNRWTDATDGEVICYNAGIYAQRPPLALHMFKNVYHPVLKPKKVIYLLCPYDFNGYGETGDTARHQGYFWDSSKVEMMTASTFLERSLVALRSTSYAVAGRGELRRYIQKGPVEHDLLFTKNGVMYPTLGKSKPAPPTAAEKEAMGNPNRKYSIPDDAAPADLMTLAKFCRSEGIEFVIVNHPVSPYSYQLLPDPDKDYAHYSSELDRFRNEGFKVIDAVADIKLTNESFPDPMHLNRWGAFTVTDYYYRNIIMKWFPEKCTIPALARPAEIPLYLTVPRNAEDIKLQHWKQSPRQMVAAPFQVLLTDEGSRLDLAAPIPPGRYNFDLYSADDRPIYDPQAESHVIAYEFRGINGQPKKVELPLTTTTSNQNRMNRTTLDFATTTTIAIVAEKITSSRGIVLDTLFVYPEKEAVPGMFNADLIEAAIRISDPMPPPAIRN